MRGFAGFTNDPFVIRPYEGANQYNLKSVSSTRPPPPRSQTQEQSLKEVTDIENKRGEYYQGAGIDGSGAGALHPCVGL
jgi:hypothetical protein